MEEQHVYIIVFNPKNDNIYTRKLWREAIDAYNAWADLKNNVYLIETKESIRDITSHFDVALEKGDTCFVAKLSDDAAWIGFPKELIEWMRKKLTK